MSPIVRRCIAPSTKSPANTAASTWFSPMPGIDPGPGFVAFDRKTRKDENAIENYTDERWDHVIDTNLNSVFTTIKAAAKHMKPRKSGRIIITTSVAAFSSKARSAWPTWRPRPPPLI